MVHLAVLESRSAAFLTQLGEMCGRPPTEEEDLLLGVEIIEKAIRAGVDRDVPLSDPPEWATKAADLLKEMAPTLPELIPLRFKCERRFQTVAFILTQKHIPFEVADPAAYASILFAREFFFGFGMPEAEAHLACCILAYVEGWVPPHETKQRLLERSVQAEFNRREEAALMGLLGQDFHGLLAEATWAEYRRLRRSADQMQGSGWAVFSVAAFMIVQGVVPLYALLMSISALLLLMKGRQLQQASQALGEQHEAHKSKLAHLQMRAVGYPRIQPPSKPAPPPIPQPPYRPYCAPSSLPVCRGCGSNSWIRVSVVAPECVTCRVCGQKRRF